MTTLPTGVRLAAFLAGGLLAIIAAAYHYLHVPRTN